MKGSRGGRGCFLAAAILAGCADPPGLPPEAKKPAGPDLSVVREVPIPKAAAAPEKPLPKEPLVTFADFPTGLVSAWWTEKDAVRSGDFVSVWRGTRRIALLETLRVDGHFSVGRIVEDNPNERLRPGDPVRPEGRPGAPPPEAPPPPAPAAPPPPPAPGETGPSAPPPPPASGATEPAP